MDPSQQPEKRPTGPIPNAKLVLNGDRVVACNQEALILLKRDREQILGRSLLEFSAPVQGQEQNAAEVLRVRTASTLDGRPQYFEWTLVRPDGDWLKTQAMMDRMQARGKLLTRLLLIRVPIVDQAVDALRKFRLGIERSNDAIFMTDPDGAIIYANPAFEKIYGYTVDEALGKTPRIMKSGMLSHEAYEEFWQTLLDKQVMAGEIINKHKDGRLLHIEGSNNPILDEAGHVVGYLAIHRDITERKAAEEALRQSQQELEQRVQERTAELIRTNTLLQEQFDELSATRATLEKRTLALETLNELARQTISSLELQPIFQQAIEAGTTLIDATSAYASVLDLEASTTHVIAKHYGSQASDLERQPDAGTVYSTRAEIGAEIGAKLGGYPYHLAEYGETYVIHADDPEIAPEEKTHMERFGAKSILGIIVRVQGEPVAEIEFWDSRGKRQFSNEEIELVQAAVRQLAVSIENARLYEQAMHEIEEREQLQEQIRHSLERRGRQVRLSTQITKDIAAAADLSDLYHRVVNLVKEQFGFYHTQLLRYEKAVDAVALIAGYGEIGAKMLAGGHSMPMGVGLIGQAAATGRSVLRPDVSRDRTWQPNRLLPDTRGELAVPIMYGDEVLGVLDVQSDKAGALDEEDQLVLEGLCGQIAIAIESTRLRQEMSGRLHELDRLQRIMSREGWQAYRAQRELAAKGYQFDQAAVVPVPESPLAVDVKPAGREPDKIGGDGGPDTVISAPMKVRGEKIGLLGIKDDPQHPLAPEDRELLESISVQVAEALESARLFEQTQKHAIEMETVARVSAAASTILDANTLLETVVNLTQERFDLYHAAVFTLEESALNLAAGTAFPPVLPGEEAPLVIDVDQEPSLVAQVARNRAPVLSNDVTQDTAYLPHPALPQTRAELAIPLIVGEEMLGVLDLQSDIAHRFGEDDVRIHTTLAAQVAVALQNATLYARQLQTAERLREVDRLKSEFLASMSHELRTPLNSIIGFADVLLEGIDGPLNDRMEEDVTLIRDSGRHLRELIGEMLDMSKIEAGVMELHYEPINLPLLANEIMANAKSLAMHKDLDINLEVDPRLRIIIADRTRLTQILLNLIGNAIKFTEQGSITLSLETDNGGLRASVQDTGVGIRQEDIPTIFEQFRQIDGSLTRKAGGTGLGLPISQKLVELHGGDMWVESEPGVGSTFTFTIPGSPPVEEQ